MPTDNCVCIGFGRSNLAELDLVPIEDLGVIGVISLFSPCRPEPDLNLTQLGI